MRKQKSQYGPRWMRECRKRLTLTQEGLAEAMGVCSNTIYRKERIDGNEVPITQRDVRIVSMLLKEAGVALPHKM